MGKVCLNCQEEDTSKLVGNLCKACTDGGVTVKGTSILMDGNVIVGPRSVAKVSKKKSKKK